MAGKIIAFVFWTLFCMFIATRSIWKFLSESPVGQSESYRAGKLTGLIVGSILWWLLIPAVIHFVAKRWRRAPKS